MVKVWDAQTGQGALTVKGRGGCWWRHGWPVQVGAGFTNR